MKAAKNSGPYWNISDEATKVTGFYYEIPPKNQRIFTSQWEINSQTKFENRQTSFSIILPRQSGLSLNTQSIKLYYPAEWKLINNNNLTSARIIARNGYFQYNTPINEDVYLDLVFKKE